MATGVQCKLYSFYLPLFVPFSSFMNRLSRKPWPWALILVLWALETRADKEWACTSTLSGHKFDFTGLGGEHVLKRERETPPTKMIDTLEFDLCKPLPESKDGADGDRARPSVFPLFPLHFSR